MASPDPQGAVGAPVPVAPVNETAMVLFPAGRKALTRGANEGGGALRGASRNLAGGCEAAPPRPCMVNTGLLPTIAETPRHRKRAPRGRQRLVHAALQA